MTTPPCLPSFLAIFFPIFPILPLHSPSTRGTTKRNGVSNSSVTATSLPDAKPSELSGVVPGNQPTRLPNRIYLESTTTEGAQVAEGLTEETNGIGDSRQKTTEIESRSSLPKVNACTVPGWSIPGKIWYQPIKLELYPLAHAYPAN